MTVLVIDIGSSSVRALLFEDDGARIPDSLHVYPNDVVTAPPGAGTLDAEEVRGLVEAAIDGALTHPRAAEIRVVGMATLAGNLVGLDAVGRAITPVYTYADARAAGDAQYLRTVMDAESIHQRTGCGLHSAYHPARLRWLLRTDPAGFEAVALWADISTYLYWHWFGQAVTSYSLASWSGLLNRADLNWHEVLLSELNLDDTQLPPLMDYDAVRQGLQPAYAARWPRLREVPFCLAVGDGAAANVGSGCLDNRRLALTLGTTAALRVVSTEILPRAPEGLWAYRIDARRHLLGGATTEGGNLYHWLKETLRLGDLSALDLRLAQRAPDSHGLTILPMLGGERSPGWAPDAVGVIHGLRFSTAPLDIAQATLEAAALRLGQVATQLKPLLTPDAPVIGGGGALQAMPTWGRMLANALNRLVYVVDEPEITSRGAALLALEAIGAPVAMTPPAIRAVIEPDADGAAVMAAAAARQQALYKRLFG